MNMIDICLKNDYVIKASPLESNGAKFQFPSNIINGKLTPSVLFTYYINDKGMQIYHGRHLVLEQCVPLYAIKPIIIADIALKMGSLYISNDLIVFEGTNKSDFTSFLNDAIPVTMDEYDYLKELELHKLVSKILANRPCAKDAESADITDGYNALVSYLENIGGID